MNAAMPTQADGKEPAGGTPAGSADVTVMVPVHDGLADLHRCLEALAASSHPRFDVLVVDDGSTEQIRPAVEQRGYGYLRIDGPGGPARARNCGVEHVRSEFVIFVDADVCVHPDTVERLMADFAADPELAAVFGAYDDQPPVGGVFSAYRNLLHHYTHCRSAGRVGTFWTGCGAIRRSVYRRYGGLDERRYRRPSIEDVELGTWMAADGRKIMLDPAVLCKHLKRWRFWSTLHIDVFRRGALWIDLMLRSRQAVRTLNVSPLQRLSVALASAIMPLAAVGVWWMWAGAAAGAAALLLLGINFPFYRYLAARKGVVFAAAAVPLHWVYFLCCAVSVPVGILSYLRGRRDACLAGRSAV